MKIRIRKKAICQYWLMYIILLLNQSVAASRYGMLLYYVAIVSAIIIAIKYCKQILTCARVIIPLIGLSFSILITRFTGGSAGIGYVIIFMANLLVAVVTYEIDKQNVVDRYVNTVSFFSIISIIMFIISQISPEFTKSLLGLSLSQEKVFSVGEGWENSANWDYYGHLFFSYGRENHRNCGLYTEPGLYAIVLISALILLLFKSEKLNKNSKKISREILLITITLVTVASATGFIMVIILFAIYWNNSKNHKRDANRTLQAKNIGLIITIIFVVGMIDYFIRGDMSFVSQYLLNKFTGFGFQNAVQMGDGSTGNARLIVLLQGIIAVIKYPLGAGTNRMSSIAMEIQSTYFNAGCGLAYFLGVLGIVGWTILVSIFIVPVMSRNVPKKIRLVMISIYIIYGISQANFWTSTLLLVAYIFEGEKNTVLNGNR